MFIFNFVKWHYYKVNKEILKAWGNFIAFAGHLFSLNLLLKTLFAPWHRVEISHGGSGFSLQTFFEKLTFNLISRIIGFLVRSFLIFWGLCLGLFFFLAGLIVFVCWQFLSPVSWPFFLLTQSKSKTDEELIKGEAKKFICQRLGATNADEMLKQPSQDIKEALAWYKQVKLIKKLKSRFWERTNLFSVSSLGSDLAFGYTLELDKYSTDLSFPPPFSHQLIGREKEISQLEAALMRSSQANVLLIGEPGVGKHTILLGLAKAIKEKRINPALFYRRVLLLNMSLLLGKSSELLAAKAKFDLLLKEAIQAGNIILVINQIEKFISGEAGVDLTPVLAQAIQSNRLQLVGVTTPQSYAKDIFPNEQLIKYFEKVEVAPPSTQEALLILEKVLPDFEKGKKVITTLPALKEIISQADKLITHLPFPEKAIDLLDQLINDASNMGKKNILKSDVDLLVSQKVKIPVGNVSQAEIEKLKNLEQILHQRVVGQQEAVLALVKAMQRSRAGIAETEKPIGTFLFLGPTGVGKTETAKALAEAYFGSEKQMTRFDMAQEFLTSLFFKEARERPFGVLLLDEFEKAKVETLNLFLTVFDEGYLKDPQGKLVSFKNMIIICTSNAGAEFIREKVSAGLKSAQVIEHVLHRGIFSPELINRFDSVVVFRPLTTQEIDKIARLMIQKLTRRLKEKGIILLAEPLSYSLLANQGFNPQFGVRPMKRLIADKIESQIAKLILDSEVKRGDKIKLTVDASHKEFKIEKYGKD